MDPEVAGSIPANGTINFSDKILILLQNFAIVAANPALFWPPCFFSISLVWVQSQLAWW